MVLLARMVEDMEVMVADMETHLEGSPLGGKVSTACDVLLQ
jgi:hypothetical protein